MRHGALCCRGLFLLCWFHQRSALSTQTQADPRTRGERCHQALVGETLLPRTPGAARGLGTTLIPKLPAAAGPSRAPQAALKVVGGGRTGEPGLPHRSPGSSPPIPPTLLTESPGTARATPPRHVPGSGCGPSFGGAQGSSCMLDPAARPRWKELPWWKELPRLPVQQITYGCSWSRHRPQPRSDGGEGGQPPLPSPLPGLHGSSTLSCLTPSFSPFSLSLSSRPPMTFPSTSARSRQPHPGRTVWRGPQPPAPCLPHAPALVWGGQEGRMLLSATRTDTQDPYPRSSAQPTLPRCPPQAGADGQGVPWPRCPGDRERKGRSPAHRNGRWARPIPLPTSPCAD